MADPIPYKVERQGAASAAPSGAVPIALYGVSGGGGGGPIPISDVNGLQSALDGKVDDSEFAAYQESAQQAFSGLEDALDTQRSNLENTTETANSAVQPTDTRLPIPISRADYDALNPPIPGQLYVILKEPA